MYNKKRVSNYLLIISAAKQALVRLNPLLLWRNIIIFIVELCAIITSIIAVGHFLDKTPYGFDLQVSLWLWGTVFFANFAESYTENLGKAQAEELKKGRGEIYAHRLLEGSNTETETVSALLLKKGDLVVIAEGMIIPSDGGIISGVALVDESAITGESAPVVRESGGDRTRVTGGTRVLSGNITVEIEAGSGETFIDQMIKMIESTSRLKTTNEKTLELFLSGSALVFIMVVIAIWVFSNYLGFEVRTTTLIALLVCLIPSTIGGLLPAIGIAGMDRLLARNVIALNSRAIEAAGDVNVVFLDKTGTITLGNRLATKFIPASGVSEKQLAKYAMLSSLADDTPEGRSIVILAKETLGLKGEEVKPPVAASFVEFKAETRMSGINFSDLQVRKGAVDAIENFIKAHHQKIPESLKQTIDNIAREGATPLVVADQEQVYGAIYLKDVLKKGMSERLLRLKRIGITSVMVTGDNPLTAAAIAAEAGVSDFIAEATPLIKLKRIKKYQEEGYLVAMIGDGTNDAPALAQADVAVAMNVGTQSAHEAANMIDLDSMPAKLLDIIAIGKQILVTRGSLTTFSLASDIAKYFAIIPAILVGYNQELRLLNIMKLATPESAIVSALIFNMLIIPVLIPLVVKGIRDNTKWSALTTLKVNLLLYGLGGVVIPFAGIKLIDSLLGWLRLVF